MDKLQTIKYLSVRFVAKPLVQKSWILLSPSLVTDATGRFCATLEVRSFVACHISHVLYSIPVACSILIPSYSLLLAFRHEPRTIFYLSFTHFHVISYEVVFLVVDILQFFL